MADSFNIEDVLGPAPAQPAQGDDQSQGAPKPQSFNINDVLGPDRQSQPMSSVYDYVFRNPSNPYGKLLSDFGLGFPEGFGTDPLGVGPETEEWLKKNGWFNDELKVQQDKKDAWEKGQIWPLIPDAGRYLASNVIQGSVGTFNLVARGAQGGIYGASSAAGGIAEQTKVPQFMDWLRGHEYQPGEFGAALSDVAQSEMMAPHALHIPEGARPKLEPVVISDARNAAINALSPDRPVTTAETIPAARSMGIIGTLKNDEGVWKGTVDRPYPDPAPIQARTMDAEQGMPEPPPAETAPDLHAIARQLAPETFAEYDPLVTQQTFLRSEIDRFEQDRVATATGPIDVEIKAASDRVGGAVESLPEKEYGEYQALLDRREDIVDRARDDAAKEMAEARQRLQDLDYRMRDLAPDVSAAYRRAQAGEVPPELPTVAPEPAGEAAPIVPVEPTSAPRIIPAEPAAAQPVTAPAELVAAGATESTGEPVRIPSPTIAADVAQRLVDAGRPADEAAAASQIVAAHYEARADRFQGAKGTADEMYQRDAAQIKAGGEGGRGGRAQGKASIKNGRTTITMFRKADASTFLHEIGHHWLEEMMSDAKDEQAPQEVRDDAAAVRKWAGASDDGPLTTAQHEKFARAFERYFLEGRAPSSRLAKVFEQFKGWLGQIYSAASKMREPISADIRDVFDRLLSKPSERGPVLTGETAKEFADIHVADAEHTPPRDAGPAADTIEREVDELAAQHSPAVSEGLNGPVTAGRGSGAGGPAAEPAAAPGAPGNAGQPEPVGAGQGAGGQPATVSGGGGQAAAESIGTPAGPGRQPAPERSTADTVGAGTKFPQSGGRLVDKAGNLVLKNFLQPTDLQTLIDVARENNDFIQARGGVVSDAQALKLADAMGLKASYFDLSELQHRIGPGAMEAVTKYVEEAANESYRLSKLVKMDDLVSVNNYLEARARVKMAEEYLAAFTANVGRAMRAKRNRNVYYAEARSVPEMVSNQLETRNLYQIQEEAERAARLDSSNKINKFIRDSDKPGAGAWALELFKHALISNIFTHAIYLEGNITTALLHAIPETLAEVAFGKIKEMATGERIANRATINEAMAQVHSLLFGQRNGLKAAHDAFMSGETVMLPGEKEAQTTPFTNTKAIPNPEIAGHIIPIGSFFRIPGERMVAPVHSYSRTMMYFQSIAQQAVRQATSEGLAGHEYDMRVASLKDSPSVGMMAKAKKFADEGTLMSKGGDLTRRISAVANWNPNVPLIGRTKPFAFIDPFVNVSSNILDQSLVQRTPLGLLSSKVRDDLGGKNGFEAQSEAAGKMILGVGIALATGGLTAQSIVNPSGPSDPHEAAIWQAEHGMPHSIRIGNMSYDLLKLGWLGQLMGVSADIYHISDKVEKGELDGVASLVMHAFAKNLVDTSAMKGVSDVMKAIDDSDRYGESYVRNLIVSGLPFSQGLGGVAREVDPYARQARTMIDAIKARIPFVSESLQPRIDVWGMPVPNREYAGLVAQRLTDDPANRALLSAGYYPALPERKIVGVQLTDAQYAQYCRLAGQMAHQLVTARISAPYWNQTPELRRHDLLRDAIEESRRRARMQLKIGSIGSMENDIIAQSHANKLAQFTAQPKDPDDY